jgi:hypothetical protein
VTQSRTSARRDGVGAKGEGRGSGGPGHLALSSGPVGRLPAARLRGAVVGRHRVGRRARATGTLHARHQPPRRAAQDVLAADRARPGRGLRPRRLRHRGPDRGRLRAGGPPPHGEASGRGGTAAVRRPAPGPALGQTSPRRAPDGAIAGPQTLEGPRPAGRRLDLEAAQERKLDYVCRKLRLRRGERLLDIGCGWGGLIVHAARRYGVDAVGIT